MGFSTGCVKGWFVRMLYSIEEMMEVVANGVGLGFDKQKKEVEKLLNNIDKEDSDVVEPEIYS